MVPRQTIDFGSQFAMSTKYGNMEFAKYIQRVIEDKDESELDSFGTYVQGMENSMLSVEMKCFLLLESILEDGSNSFFQNSRNAFIKTSSSVLVEHIDDLLDRFRSNSESVTDLHMELVELLLDYLDGC